ncbi:transposase [Salinibacter ruber]|uniref:transposase n=1 Tax=Salinibacter ruber TaxID=146919 RepID=UPI00311AA344
MSNSLRIQRKMQSTLSQLLPDALVTRRRALAQMITGLHLAEHVHLSKVAGRIAGTARLESKTRHLRRFLGNEDVDPERFYSPVRDCLIDLAVQGTQTEGTGPFRILVDTLELSGERQVLVAGIAYRRRALPICWETYRREGVTNAGQQISLLRALAGLFPEDTEVVVVGDGAFHSTDLMEFIEDQGWHFCLRLHADTYIRSFKDSSKGFPKEGTWKQLRDLVPEEGERRYLQDVPAGERQRIRPRGSRPLPSRR